MKKKGCFFVAVALTGFTLMSTGCADNSVPENAVRVVVFDRGTDGGKTNPANNRYTQWIQEKVKQDLGLDIVFFPVPRYEEEQIQTALMASGNPPDLMLTYNEANVSVWSAQGGLFDMAPYIDTHLADARTFLGPDEAIPGRELIFRNQNLETGELFSVRARRALTARNGVFIRTDWLDALGLPMPTNHEEFFNALVAFRDYNPGGVERGVPWIMNVHVLDRAMIILDSFIDPNLSTEESWVNTVLGIQFMLPNYKEGVRFMNRMFNAGLIDPDFALYKDDTTIDKQVLSGRVGAFEMHWGSNPMGNPDADPNHKWAALDAFPSSDGLTHKTSYDAAGVFIFIPKAAKNPEGAMRYLNWLAKFENYNFLQLGPEGITHEMVDGWMDNEQR